MKRRISFAIVGAVLGVIVAPGLNAQDNPNYALRQYPLRVFVSASALTDINGDSIPDFIAAGRSSFSSPPAIADQLQVHLGQGDGTFAPNHMQAALGRTWGIASGDFDEDGIGDVALCNGDFVNEPRTLRVLRGTRAGSLQETWSDDHGSQVSAIAAGDMNGDGHLDLILVQHGTNPSLLVVHLGAGDGTFPLRIVNPAPFVSYDIDVADFDGDGKLDVVAPQWGDVENVSLFRGNGNGLLQAGTPVAPDSSFLTTHVEVGDVNGDARPDLLIQLTYPKLLLNAGDGEFSPVPPTTVGPAVLVSGLVRLHDFDGDGRDDLIANASPNIYVPPYPGSRIWRANEGGSLVPDGAAFTSTAIGPDAHLADLDCDGSVDVVAAFSGGGTFFAVVMGHRGVGLRPETFVDVTEPSGFIDSPLARIQDVVLADMDLDGTTDMVLANRRSEPHPQGSLITVVQGGPDLADTTTNWSTLVTGNPTEIAVGRLNGDQWPDVVLVDPTLEKLKQLNGHGDGILNSPIVRDVDGIPRDVALADMDADGDNDIVLLTVAPDTIQVMSNQGGNVFDTIDVEVLPSTAWELAIADANDDGHQDVIIRRSSESDLALFSGSPTGELTASGSVAFPGAINSFLLRDVDRDGHLDALATDWFEHGLFIRWGRGGWHFEAPETVSLASLGDSIAIGDFNDDGRTDIAVSHGFVGAHVSFLLGRGNRDLAPPVQYQTAGNTHPLRAGDVDGDGVTDLVSGGGGNVGLLIDLPHGSWKNLGHPLSLAPHVPRLCGAAADGNSNTIGYVLDLAPPFARTALFLSPRRGDTPFQGGTLVPTPALMLDLGFADSAGQLTIETGIPPGLPQGVDLYAQAWLQSGGSIAASNALVTTLP